MTGSCTKVHRGKIGVCPICERDEYYSRMVSANTMLVELIDAHYGVSYHHIGDGDGISKEMADKLREFMRTIHIP